MTDQSRLLGIPRSSVYYTSQKNPNRDMEFMKRIDAIHTKHPYYGSRRIRAVLGMDGVQINRKHVRALMIKMGIAGTMPVPATSKSHPENIKLPYLLRGVKIEYPMQVWSTDITYIRTQVGFVYLVAIMDWFSRFVLAWKLSNSLDGSFCIEALEEALKYGSPEIFNTDQGVQFT